MKVFIDSPNALFLRAVALTHDNHSFKKGRYLYSNSFGLLTMFINNTVYKIDRVNDNAQQFVSLVCLELGYSNGYLINGPSLSHLNMLGYLGPIYHLTSECEGVISRSPPCFRIDRTYHINMVHYMICSHKNEEVREKLQ
jgi:hypothetical protein